MVCSLTCVFGYVFLYHLYIIISFCGKIENPISGKFREWDCIFAINPASYISMDDGRTVTEENEMRE